MSLNLGADDFITKPYNMHILQAHIATVLHRAYGRKQNMMLTHKGLALDILKGRISYQGKEADLTKNEPWNPETADGKRREHYIQE